MLHSLVSHDVIILVSMITSWLRQHILLGADSA